MSDISDEAEAQYAEALADGRVAFPTEPGDDEEDDFTHYFNATRRLSDRLRVVETERNAYLERLNEVNVERQRQEVRAITAEDQLHKTVEALWGLTNAVRDYILSRGAIDYEPGKDPESWDALLSWRQDTLRFLYHRGQENG